MLLTVASTAPPTSRPVCVDDQWQCADGLCINATLRCDRKYHCRDGTDEFDCSGKWSFTSSEASFNSKTAVLKFIMDRAMSVGLVRS